MENSEIRVEAFCKVLTKHGFSPEYVDEETFRLHGKTINVTAGKVTISRKVRSFFSVTGFLKCLRQAKIWDESRTQDSRIKKDYQTECLTLEEIIQNMIPNWGKTSVYHGRAWDLSDMTEIDMEALQLTLACWIDRDIKSKNIHLTRQGTIQIGKHILEINTTKVFIDETGYPFKSPTDIEGIISAVVQSRILTEFNPFTDSDPAEDYREILWKKLHPSDWLPDMIITYH